MEICLSNLPGLKRALSKISGRFVPAKTTTWSEESNPSISTNNWFKVFSLSSLPPIFPLPLSFPIASISSTNIMAGAISRAVLNKSRTAEAPTPTNISTNSEPDTDKNGTPASPAVALAKSVLPVPGGPDKMAPAGILAPNFSYLVGSCKNLTNSMISSFDSSHPATSLNLILTSVSWLKSLALDFPILKIPPGPPPPMPEEAALRKVKYHKPPISKAVGKIGKI